MGSDEVEQFLLELVRQGDGAGKQVQARAALSFLYREVLGKELPWPEVARARTGPAEAARVARARFSSTILSVSRNILAIPIESI